MAEDSEPQDDLQGSDNHVEPERYDEGPGWMPAIMAGTVMLGIVGFISCAFSTWFLYQQRTEMALRTLQGSVIPYVEQGLLDPDTKQNVVGELTSLANDLERGMYENWQAAGAMSQLIRIPIYQWGEIQAIEAFLKNEPDDSDSESLKQLSRLKRSVELGLAISVDFEHILDPVRVRDPDGPTGFTLKQPMDDEAVAEVVERAKLVADRSEIPDELFENIRLESIVGREIERGISN